MATQPNWLWTYYPDVAREVAGLPAPVDDLADHLPEGLLAPAGDQHARAPGGQLEGDGPADPMSPAGHESHLAAEGAPQSHRSYVSGLVAAHLQWHLERQLKTLPLVERTYQADRTIAVGEIADHLYGTSELGDVNAIEALIMRLRRKIGSDSIETRRGFGYRLTGGAT